MLALLLAASVYVAPPGLQRAQASTVTVHAIVKKTQLLDEDGNDTDHGAVTTKAENICSGWVAYTKKITDGAFLSLVVTAKHCTQPQTASILDIPFARIELTPDSVGFKNGDRGQVVAVMPATNADDIAFLGVLTAAAHPPLWPALSLPEQGDNLFVYGMPLGQEFALSPATMMQDHTLYHDDDPSNPPWENDSYLIACPACGPGDSGGPVLNTSGQVVGILNAGGDNAQSLMFPLERLRYWLAVMGNP